MLRRALCLLGLLAAGCDVDSSRDGAPCPCLDGWTCCELSQTCVRDLNQDCGPPGFAIIDVSPDEGPVAGGTEIVVSGRDFEGVAAVWVGDQPCGALRVESPARMRCVTPPGPQNRSVVDLEAVRGEERARLADGFHYVHPPFVDATDPVLNATPWAGMGVSLADVDRDGRLDIFFSNGSRREFGVSATLFAGRGGLLYEDISAAGWALPLHPNYGAGIADFDADGHMDLFVATREPLTSLVLGDGALSFTPGEASRIDPGEATMEQVRLLDVDGDHHLDAIGVRYKFGGLPPGPELVTLLRGTGSGFEESPAQVRLDLERLPDPVSLRCLAIGDFDRDGDADVVAAGNTVIVLRNDDGVLVDDSLAHRIPATLAGTVYTLALVDYDGDGDPDLSGLPRSGGEGTLMWRNVDGRFEPEPPIGGDSSALGELDPTRRMRGASLFTGTRSGVWLDADHDGDLDLLVPQPRGLGASAPALYRSRFAQGDPRLDAELLRIGGAITHPTGMAVGDLDGDGDLDAVVNNWRQTPGRRLVLRNTTVENSGTAEGPAGAWLRVRAVTDEDGDATDPDVAGDRDAFGVSVELDMDGPPQEPDFAVGAMQMRVIGGGARCSQSEAIAHFGLGEVTGPLWVRARFPDGSVARRRIDLGELEGGGVSVELRDCAGTRCD